MHNITSQLIQENIPLSLLTTMRVGGRARFFSRVQTIEELKEVVSFAQGKGLPFFILGSGSNIIISDKGFSGVVIKLEIQGITFEDETLLVAGAGEVWDDVVSASVLKSLHGIENLSAIPGTVGAAPIQNIGAYGMEVSQTIKWVLVLNTKTMKLSKISSDECAFLYRDSVFKREGKHLIVTRVAFLLEKNGKTHIDYKDLKNYFSGSVVPPSIGEVREAIITIRGRKLPNIEDIGTVGSFFKNPIITNALCNTLRKTYPELPSYKVDEMHVKIPLAWILDHVCNLNGYRCGNVGIFKTQPQALVHFGNGSAHEVMDFAELIKARVQKEIGIEIEKEITFIE